jgi:cation diffusion facilitator CzcD-associated flavoprotein CzcO
MTRTDAELGVDARSIACDWLRDFAVGAAAGDADALSKLILDDGWWRDVVALTWDLDWAHAPAAVGARLAAELTAAGATGFEIDTAANLRFVPDARSGYVEAYFRFETEIGLCRGHVRLRREASTLSDTPREWRSWTIVTALDALKGRPEALGHHRPLGFDRPGEDWGEKRRAHLDYRDHDPRVVVIGTGHAGLAVAARLGRMGIDTLMLESLPRVGDNWRNRYKSLYLHNEVWMNDFPYLPFPKSWPLYTGKDKLGDWLEFYALALDLNVWTSSGLEHGDWDEREQRWHLHVRRDGEQRVISPRHVVLATGIAGDPVRMDIPGSDGFDGEVLYAQDYTGDTEVKGKRVLVVGTGSSAHDIARDCALEGADVTMLQRNATVVISLSPGAGFVYSRYGEGVGPLEDLDLAGLAAPLPLISQLQGDVSRRIAEVDADLLAGLNRAGFRTHWGPDGGGMLMAFYRHGGGYYIDVGASRMIIDGEIKVKSGVEIARLEKDRVVFTDGDTLDVDLVVLAVGFGNMQDKVRHLFGEQIAERVGPIWGIGPDGELRNMWRRTPQPGFWVSGSSFAQSRSMSHVLAIQIAGQEFGVAPSTPIVPAPRDV